MYKLSWNGKAYWIMLGCTITGTILSWTTGLTAVFALILGLDSSLYAGSQ